MNKPHKHAELIKAWADGQEVQYRLNENHEWQYIRYPIWKDDVYYRIKPETIRYRVVLCVDYKGYKYTFSVNEVDYRPNLERESYFVKWIGDWQEVEV